LAFRFLSEGSLIVRLIVQTIRRDRSQSIWIDAAPRVRGQFHLEPIGLTRSARLRIWRLGFESLAARQTRSSELL
jgi:hypothetical protein